MDLTIDVGAQTSEVPRARHELTAALRSAAVAVDLDCVGLVVTELVANALLHGSPPVVVRAHADGDRLRLEVVDGGGPRVPGRRETQHLDVSGRGLVLVAGVADRWGVEPRGSGTLVWAEFADTTSATAGPLQEQHAS